MKKFLVIFLILFTIFVFHSKQISKEDYNVLKFSSWGSQSEVKIIKELLYNFEKENNVKVEFIHIPQNYFQKIHLMFASNIEPDVIFINNQYIKMYIDAGLLENLTPYFENEEKYFYPEAINCFKYKDTKSEFNSDENKLYAIPRDISNIVIFINKDIFKKHGIAPKIELNNIYELKELAQKLTTKSYWGINTEEDPLFWLNFLAANGGGVLSDKADKLIITDTKSIEALNLYSDFVNKYHISPSKSEIGSMTTAQMFINQKIAMYMGGRWMVPKFKETIPFNWDVIEFPSSDKNKIYLDASGWAVSKKSKKKELAVKLIKYLSSETASDKFTYSYLIIPARISSGTKLTSSKSVNSLNENVFISEIKKTKPTPVNKNYREINDILKDKSQLIFSGNINAREAFDDKTVKKLESLI